MAIDPTPARVNASAPRPSVSSAARAATTSNDHSSTIAGFPLNAASERVPPARSWSEKSGAGNGSYIQVARGAEAGAGTEDVVFAADRGLKASVSIAPPSTIRRRVFSGTSVNTCVPPEGQLTVSFKTRSLAPRPMSSSFECCDRNPEPACTILILWSRSVSTVTRAPIASRLLVVPRRRTASDADFVSKSFRKIRSCGACRSAITTRSGSPSPSMSRTANDRPS